MSAKLSLLILFMAVAIVGIISRKPAGPLRLDHDFSNTLKGIAMLMILYHHTGIYHAKELWYFYLSGWGFCGVSIYFFVSGYGLMVSYAARSYTYLEYFRRRLFVLWPMIVLCMMTRWILSPLMTVTYLPTINPLYLLGFFEWYILAITFWYIVFIVIRKQSKSVGDILLCFFAVLLSHWAVLDIFSGWSYQASLWLRFPFSFTLGIIFAIYSDQIIKYLNSRLFFATISSFIVFFLTIHVLHQDSLVPPLLDLITPLIGLCMVLWIYYFGSNSHFLLWMGRCSLPLYLLQVPLIKYGTFLTNWRIDALGILATWGVIFLLSALIVWINSKFHLLILRSLKYICTIFL